MFENLHLDESLKSEPLDTEVLLFMRFEYIFPTSESGEGQWWKVFMGLRCKVGVSWCFVDTDRKYGIVREQDKPDVESEV